MPKSRTSVLAYLSGDDQGISARVGETHGIAKLPNEASTAHGIHKRIEGMLDSGDDEEQKI